MHAWGWVREKNMCSSKLDNLRRINIFFGKEHDKSSSEKPILKSIYTHRGVQQNERFIAENTKRKNQFFKENPQNENEFPLESTLFMLPLYELCVVKVRWPHIDLFLQFILFFWSQHIKVKIFSSCDVKRERWEEKIAPEDIKPEKNKIYLLLKVHLFYFFLYGTHQQEMTTMIMANFLCN